MHIGFTSQLLMGYLGDKINYNYCSLHAFSVPGLLGSQMEAKLDKTSGPRFCEKHHDWYTIWLDIASLIFEECFADNTQ